MDLDGLFDRAEIAGDLLVQPSDNDVGEHPRSRGVSRDLRLIEANSADSDLASSARAIAPSRSLVADRLWKSMAPAFMAYVAGMSPLRYG
jgi:hypothetical protein